MIRHVVILRWKEGVTAEQRTAAVTRLRGLPLVVPTIRSYAVAENLGIDPDTDDLVIIADFDDLVGYETYRDHPDHQTVIREVTKPIIAGRAAVQIEWPVS